VVVVRRIWVIFDLAVVLLFVAIGRSVHEHGLSVAGMASTTWPFVTGLVLGWIAAALWRRSLTSVVDGIIVCLVTVAVGMTLRVIAGQGTALAFILVALGFLGALMIGWRASAACLLRMRSTSRVG